MKSVYLSGRLHVHVNYKEHFTPAIKRAAVGEIRLKACGVNSKVFIPEFYRLHDQNYSHFYSGSHTNTIAYSDLQVYMSGLFNTITFHTSTSLNRS